MTEFTPTNILVIKSRNIGDVLLTGPLVSTLHAQYPDAHITALVKAGTEEMLLDHPDLDQVMTYPKRSSNCNRLQFLLRDFSWQWGLRKFKFDMVINTTEGERGALTAYLSKAPKRIGLKMSRNTGWRKKLLTDPIDPVKNKRRHTVIRNLDLSGVPTEKQIREVKLVYHPEDLKRVDKQLAFYRRDASKPLVWVHPASRWFFKCWTNKGMATVIDYLHSVGNQVVLTSGPEDRERYQVSTILQLCKTKDQAINLSARLSLKELAALGKRADLFFGVDTAPMHMAAAMNVPVVAIFGPSGTFDWGPWPNGWQGEDTPYPNQSGVQYAGPHTVIQKDWECAPCGQDGCDGSKRSSCLDQLSVEEVLPSIRKALAALSTGEHTTD